MPFIVQCPHTQCRKYMLLEDSARGTRVECLLCKRMIEVDTSGSGDRPKVPPMPKMPGQTAAAPQEAPTAERQRVLRCPECQSPLRVPAGHEGKQLRCPRCKHVFTP